MHACTGRSAATRFSFGLATMALAGSALAQGFVDPPHTVPYQSGGETYTWITQAQASPSSAYVFYCKDSAGNPTVDFNEVMSVSTSFYLRFGGTFGWSQPGYCLLTTTDNGGATWSSNIIVNGYFIFGNPDFYSFEQIRSNRTFTFNGVPRDGYTNANFGLSAVATGDALISASSFAGGGPAQPGVLVADPIALDFGPMPLGGTSQSRTVTLSNSGGTPLQVGGASLTGANVADFQILRNGCTGATLAPSQTCTLSLAFSPTALGPRTATLQLQTAANTLGISASGTGVTAPGVPSPSLLALTPSSGRADTTVFIRGANFGALQGAGYVTFATASASRTASIVRWGENLIIAQAPNGLVGTSQVRVTTAGGTTPALPFAYPAASSFTVAQPVPPLKSRQDFGGAFRSGTVQLQFAFLEFASAEWQGLGSTNINGNAVVDQCYAGAMDAAAFTAQRGLVSEALLQLVGGVVRAAARPVTSTGVLFYDLLLAGAQEGLTAVLNDEPVAPAAATAVAREVLSHVLARETNRFLSGAALLTLDLGRASIQTVLRDEDVVSWEYRGSNAGSRAQRSAELPSTSIQAKLYYNPWNHYTTVIVRATCQGPGPTRRALYMVTYENSKGTLGSASVVGSSVRRRAASLD